MIERTSRSVDEVAAAIKALQQTDVPALNKLIYESGIGRIDAGMRDPLTPPHCVFAGSAARLKRTLAARVGLSVVTEMELRYGLARNPRLRIAPLVEEFLAGITVVPLTSEVARVCGRIARSSRRAARRSARST